MSCPVLFWLSWICQALKNNLQIVRRAAPGSRVWSVVKANGYGHGIESIWSALSATDGFALLNLEEAILLRERGWKGPILLLEGFFHADELPLLDKYRLTTSVHSNWQIKALQNAKLHSPLDIYLKMNSGMNRLGFQPERVHTVWQQLRAIKNVGEMTLMAHFADAEKPDGITDAMARIEHGRRARLRAFAVELRRDALAPGSALSMGASRDCAVWRIAVRSVAGHCQQRA